MQDVEWSSWLLGPCAGCWWQTVRDGRARRLLWVSRRACPPSCLLLLPASNTLRRHFPPTDKGIEGIQSANQLPISAGKGSSICPSLQSTSDRPLFIHKSLSLFIHWSHFVSQGLSWGWDVPTHKPTQTHTFKRPSKIASRPCHFVKLLNVLRKRCDADWWYEGKLRNKYQKGISQSLTSVKVLHIIIQQRAKKQHANLKALFMDFHQFYGFIYYLQLRSVTSYEGAWPDAGLVR